MKKISKKILEMVLEHGVYDTRKYRYKAEYHTVFVKDEESVYHAKHYVRVKRMPMEYFGTAAMLNPGAWDITVDIEL